MTQVYNYLIGRNPRVAIQPVDLGKTGDIFFFFRFFITTRTLHKGKK